MHLIKAAMLFIIISTLFRYKYTYILIQLFNYNHIDFINTYSIQIVFHHAILGSLDTIFHSKIIDDYHILAYIA